jgi:hypothetical protein
MFGTIAGDSRSGEQLVWTLSVLPSAARSRARYAPLHAALLILFIAPLESFVSKRSSKTGCVRCSDF